MSGLKRFGVATSLLIAGAGIFVFADYLISSAPDSWFGYPALGFVMVGGALSACWAWATDNRLLAVPGHILTLFAPWGFMYFIPLLAVVLAFLAGATFRSSQQVAKSSQEELSQVPSLYS